MSTVNFFLHQEEEILLLSLWWCYILPHFEYIYPTLFLNNETLHPKEKESKDIWIENEKVKAFFMY